MKKLIVGLGNPGLKYRKTRHNVGFLTADALCKKWGLHFEPLRKIKAEAARNEDIVVIKPLTYMNLSGFSVKEAMSSYKVPLEGILVISDDADLPFGKLKERKGVSSGGQKGLKSIEEALQSREFLRLKLGIGRPPEGQALEDYVLEPFRSEEEEGLTKMIEEAVTIIERWSQE